MKLHDVGPWPATPEEAIALQHRLAPLVSQGNEAPEEPRLIAGVDTSGQDRDGQVQAAVVLLQWSDFEIVEVQVAHRRPTLPYIPGLLAFREAPVLVGALERLRGTPDLILVDGHGRAHPRQFGIACHVGLITQIPTIGCAKSLLTGHPQPLDAQQGAWSELVDRGEVIGAAVRTREGTTPVYISVGHRVSLPAAVRWALACCRGYRLPEPIRQAHRAAGGQLSPTPVGTIRSGVASPSIAADKAPAHSGGSTQPSL